MKKVILSILVLILSIDTYATHAAGMDISYECINQGTNSDTYKVTVKFYRDCEGIANWGTLYLDYSSSCGSNSTSLTQVGNAVNINPNCLSYCNGGSGIGIEQYTYEAVINLSKCSNWVLSVCEAARNNSIGTISNPGQEDLCVEATLNNIVFCNNSPTFTQYPTPFICVGSYYCYNNGAVEIDGDSLVYSLVTPLVSNNGGTVNYIPPYSITNPVGGGSSFDPNTGNLCVTPPNLITGVLAIKVTEYRNGLIIGSIIRDIQINTFSCTATNPPQLSAIDTSTVVDISNSNTFTEEVNCPNGTQNINFDINAINNNPPAPMGYQFTINITSGTWPNEVSWDIYDPNGAGAGTIIASGGAPYTGTICLPATNLGNLQFRMYDSWGDGWNGATYTLSGNSTLTGTTTGTLNFGSLGVNNFNITGGSNCTIGGTSVFMSWNNGIPGATYTINNNNTANPVGTFNWTPTLADIAGSPYFFTVNVTNDACPVPGNFSFQYQIILNNSDISISPIITNPSCNGENNGEISSTITSSSTPLNYSWSNGSSNQNIDSLIAGNYTLTVTDSLGCSVDETYTLVDPPIYNPSTNHYNVSCFGFSNGSIEVLNEPISTTFLWSNNTTSNNISNLTAGFYSVDLTNIDGCIYTEFFNITQPTQIVVNPTYNDISCYGLNDGNIDLNISGGIPDYIVNIPPFTQVLLNGATNYSTQSTLVAGTYNYFVTDSNNCTVSDTITILEPSILSTAPNISDVLCKNEANGIIILNTFGGTAPYTESFTGYNPLQMEEGTYFYSVIDQNGCLFADTFIINEPDSLLTQVSSTDASCASYQDGTATLIINGGTLPYNTNWNGSNPSSLGSGLHLYTVTDNNGCISQGNITINEPPGMLLVIDTFSVSCFGGNDGSANLNISGGAGPPYNTFWGGLNINALPAGNHIVTVSDVNNCSLTDTAFITQPEEIQVTPIINDVSCFGDINGNVFLQLNGGTPPLIENWFGIDSSYLAPGNYYYEITDANLCVKNGSISIIEPNPLTVQTTTTDVDCFGNNSGIINLEISGGTPSYNSDFGVFDPLNLFSGTYPFTIVDANGCQLDSSATVNEANEIFVDFIATSPICRYEESILSININSALTNTFTLLLDDSVQSSFVLDTNGLLIPEGIPITLTPNFSGKVNLISLTDALGCTQIFNDSVHIEVKQLPVLAINEDDICFGEPSYNLVNATPNGGTYFINNEMTSFFDVENLDFGAYKIRYEYTDPATNCYNEITDTITISDSPQAEMLFSPQPTDLNNPEIFFRDNSDEEIVSSIWDLGDGTIVYDDLNFYHTYLDTGSYDIRYYVTNKDECTDSAFVTIKINPIYSVFIPDAFTPNNDGDNDVFMPSIIGSSSYNIKIFDRWGSVIYNEDNKMWNGKINENLVNNGTYPYSITVTDYNGRIFIYTGTVTIVK